ncbi:MAG: zinc-ribbon domain-containing protein [Bacilli bacterium]|nr:zinc-ribbon domain-containing protein [Bacilli bacterium]
MYCRKCGNELKDNDKFCGKCGEPKAVVNNNPTVDTTTPKENPNEKILYGALGFISPIVGLIVSLLSKKDKPEAAKVGIIVSCIRFAFNVIYVIVYFLFIVVNL